MAHLEASSSIWIFIIHSFIAAFGLFWAFKLYKLSKAWKHIWIILIMSISLSVIRRALIAFCSLWIDETIWEFILIDLFPLGILACTSVVMMSLWFLFRKYLDSGGKLK